MAGIRERYPYTIIDCPPSLGLLTVNALAASDFVIIPLQCEYYALEGLVLLLKTISIIKKKLNPELEILGVLLTMFDKRNNLSFRVMEEARRHLGSKVFQTVIPRNVRLSEAPELRETRDPLRCRLKRGGKLPRSGRGNIVTTRAKCVRRTHSEEDCPPS